jgi:predicted ribosomally synthesized peptide with nif11-like leader
MSMHDAFAFIDRCGTDHDFRFALYDANGPLEFKAAVRGAGFDFVDSELSDAVSNRKLKARDEDDAAEIDDFAKWYRAMAGEDATGSEVTNCGTSCSACPSSAACVPRAACRPGADTQGSIE